MQFAYSFLVLATTLAFASAAVLPEKRATSDVVCDSTAVVSGTLVAYSSDIEESVNAALGSTTTTDSRGKKAKVLITKGDDGADLAAQTFDFTPCTSKYLGYPAASSTKTTKRVAICLDDDSDCEDDEDPEPIADEIVYGHLSLGGAKKHCLMTKTGSVKTADQVLTHSVCSQVDDKSQLQNTWAMNLNTGAITFVGQKFNGTQHPTSLSISSVNHRAVKLNANEDGRTSFYLQSELRI